jgi:glycosyltransferase involved in cell wall biosynthesis
MGIALAHDYLLVLRGAERTFATISDMWPDAPVYTLLYDEERTEHRFAQRTVVTSRLQRLGAHQENFRLLLPLLGPAMRAFSLDGHDCVISSSSAFAHLLRVPDGVPHICYCHAPFRYAWDDAAPPLKLPRAARPLVSAMMQRHRANDRRAARRIDQFVANSWFTRDRIKRLWGREAVVIHPPVDVSRFRVDDPEDYVLFVGELVSHKRADRAIEAARHAGRKIKVVGGGPELAHLREWGPAHAEFLGRVSDTELEDVYARAAAVIVPNVEEFSIVAVEAQAAGRPVVAVDAGGVRETVVAGTTGILVDSDNPVALGEALASDMSQFDPVRIQLHAQQFSRLMFETRMEEVVAATRGGPPVRQSVSRRRHQTADIPL